MNPEMWVIVDGGSPQIVPLTFGEDMWGGELLIDGEFHMGIVDVNEDGTVEVRLYRTADFPFGYGLVAAAAAHLEDHFAAGFSFDGTLEVQARWH